MLGAATLYQELSHSLFRFPIVAMNLYWSSPSSCLVRHSVRHLIIVQADMVAQFVDDGIVHFLHHLLRTLTQSEDRSTIDGNLRRWFSSRPEERISRQRPALIQAEQVVPTVEIKVLEHVFRRFFPHHDGDRFHQFG